VHGGAAGAEFVLPEHPDVEVEVEVVEGGPALRARPVGTAAPGPFDAFLDGIQRQRIAGFCGPVPIVCAYAAAVIRTRRAGAMATLAGAAGAYREERERVFVPFRYVDTALFEAAGIGREQLCDTNPVDPPLPLFPPALWAAAANAINHWREDLERSLAVRWCRAGEAGWLVVDGGLGIAPEAVACGRAIGIVKHHRTRFFDGEDARVLLGLRAGERTSVFRPLSGRRGGDVYSWFLRTRSPVGHDVFWGLVRIEAAASEETLSLVDTISRWLLAEAAPLSLPDARWDRMIYPIRDCEEYLRARAPW